MKIVTFEQFIPKENLSLDGLGGLKRCYETYLSKKIQRPHRIIRFVITKSDELGYHSEIDSIIFEKTDTVPLSGGDIFNFRARTHENTEKFTTVLFNSLRGLEQRLVVIVEMETRLRDCLQLRVTSL